MLRPKGMLQLRGRLQLRVRLCSDPYLQLQWNRIRFIVVRLVPRLSLSLFLLPSLSTHIPWYTAIIRRQSGLRFDKLK